MSSKLFGGTLDKKGRMQPRMMILAIGGLLALGSCVSLTPAGARVRITTNPEVVRGCAFLGEAKATTQLGRAFGSTGVDDSERKLKNKVAEMGGNVVMIRRQDENMMGSARSVGEVYKCSESVLAPPPTTTPSQ